MAHFAQVDSDNIVLQVINISNDVIGEPTLTYPETQSAGRAFIYNTLKLSGGWYQTSYNNNFAGLYAGIGYTYDAALDEFVAPPTPEPVPSA